MTARIVGVGQPLAGDDAVGLAVVRFLREAGVPPHVELLEITEPSDLVGLWDDVDALAIVDAIVSAGAPGEVHELTLEQLEALPPVSTHGLGVAQSLRLAQALSARPHPPRLRILGVEIEPPQPGTPGLSPAVAAAVPRVSLRLLDGLS